MIRPRIHIHLAVPCVLLLTTLLVFWLSGSGGVRASDAPAASPVIASPGAMQVDAAAEPTATATLTNGEFTINGSGALSVTVPTSGRIAFVSGSGWIGYFGDAGCTNLLGSARSPQDEAASFFSTAYGSTFWVAGVTESNVVASTCRQVSIADPTPTPLPPPSMTIQGKTGDAFIDDSNIVDFAVPQEAGTSWTLYYFLDGGCLSYVAKTAFPESGHLYITGRELEDTVGQPTLSVYAMREPDGATSPCQRIDIGYAGEQNTPTPTPPTPTGPPATSPPGPTVIPPTTVAIAGAAPTNGAGAGVTSLPNTGAGPHASTIPATLLLAGALTAFAMVVVGGIGCRRRSR